MLIDARTLPSGTTLEADVCVVGAGAAGITLARELAGTAVRVALLESGGLDPDARTQALCEGENVGLPYFPLEACRLRYFGGSTNHWAGECRPLDAIDFEVRPGVAHSGWPIADSDLSGYYERAHVLCQLSPVPYDPEIWASDETPPLSFEGGDVVTQMLQLPPPTRFGSVYRDDILDADNIRTVLYANVVEIETPPEAQRVTGLRVATLDGTAFRVAARLFVLAAGAIENARLLLLSNRRERAGLGNRHDLVGRFFMEHRQTEAGLLLAADRRHPSRLYAVHSVRKPGLRGVVRASLTLSPEALRSERLLNFRCELSWLPVERFDTSPSVASLQRLGEDLRERRLPDDLVWHLRLVLGDLRRVGRFARANLFGSPPPLVRLRHVAEQEPNPESRVTLGAGRDALRMRRVRLDWRITETDRHSIRRTQEILAREIGRAGLGRVRLDLEPSEEFGQFHHMGTTRMHADPKLGVVDAHCRVHGVANLFVAGSSVFATSGAGAPTLTIVALALRLADRIKEVLRG